MIKMVSKRVVIMLVIIALLLVVISIVVSMTVSSMSKIPEKNQDSNVNVKPATESGQVSLIINKPASAP